MKAISLWQPWASAIALGCKRIETRHWSTHYRGPIAIHAAKRWTGDERHFAELVASEYDVRLRTPPLGAIVATAKLTACRRSEDLIADGLTDMEEAFGNYGPQRFGWVFLDIVALPTPIPFSGHQGLFDVPDHIFGHGDAAAQGALL